MIVLPADAQNATRVAVLPLAGGPGQGAAELAPVLAPRFAPLRRSRDLVFVDQRGTGQSNGLHCASAATARDLMGKIFDPPRLAVCRDELLSRADLTKYTTAHAAGDYEKVLDALGYAQVDAIGISYGSRMALELARRFPARIRSMTIEAVVPPGFTWPSRGAGDAEAALTTLLDDCHADRQCRGAFPAFREDVETAFTSLQRRPVRVQVQDPGDGATVEVPFGISDLAYATRGMLYNNDALSLPMWFRRAAQGEYDAFAQAYVTRARRLEREIARGVHLAVYCAEDLPFVDQDAASRAAAGTRLGAFLLNEYRGACEVWPRAPIPASFRAPVTSAVPTLLMSGRRDPVTPPRSAEETARTLSRARVVVWKYGGHGTDGLVTDTCRTSILQQFIATADPHGLPLDCMQAESPLPFRMPRPQRPAN